MCMCVVDLEKVFDRLPRLVLEWAMRKRGMPDVLLRSVICLCEGARTRIRVDSLVLMWFVVNVGMHKLSLLSPFLFCNYFSAVTEFAREDELCVLLYADDLLMMSVNQESQNEFIELKEIFECKWFKVSLEKAMVMVK